MSTSGTTDGGFPGGTITEVSVNPRTEGGAARALRLDDLRELCALAEAAGVPGDQPVIFQQYVPLHGSVRVRVTAAGLRIPAQQPAGDPA